jgi:hypothetical protein
MVYLYHELCRRKHNKTVSYFSKSFDFLLHGYQRYSLYNFNFFHFNSQLLIVNISFIHVLNLMSDQPTVTLMSVDVNQFKYLTKQIGIKL